MRASRRLLSEVPTGAIRYSVKASRASSRAATLRIMLGAELPGEPLPVVLVGGLPLLFCPPLLPEFATDVTVGVGVVLPVCAGLAEGVGERVRAVVGVGIGVAGVGEGVGVGVGVQLHETLTMFAGPLKMIVSFAGQVMLAGMVMFTVSCFLGGSVPCAG
jgi:hypothetical protein